MQGKLIMSCGCEETDARPGEYVSFGDYDTFDDGSYGPCIVYSHMCRPCVDRLRAHGAPFFATEEEAGKWVSQEREIHASRPV